VLVPASAGACFFFSFFALVSVPLAAALSEASELDVVAEVDPALSFSAAWLFSLVVELELGGVDDAEGDGSGALSVAWAVAAPASAKLAARAVMVIRVTRIGIPSY
jgi:hypothetical protein